MGNKSFFMICDLCLKSISKEISYNVFVVNTEGNKNKYTSNELVNVCRNCYLNNEKIKRSF